MILQYFHILWQSMQVEIIKLLAAPFTNNSNRLTFRLLRNNVNLHITFMIVGAQNVLFKTTNAGASKTHRGYLFGCPVYVPNGIN